MRRGQWSVAAMAAAVLLCASGGQSARAGITDDLMDTTKHPVSVTMAMQADSFFRVQSIGVRDLWIDQEILPWHSAQPTGPM